VTSSIDYLCPSVHKSFKNRGVQQKNNHVYVYGHGSITGMVRVTRRCPLQRWFSVGGLHPTGTGKTFYLPLCIVGHEACIQTLTGMPYLFAGPLHSIRVHSGRGEIYSGCRSILPLPDGRNHYHRREST
jgi:hypothetical protein